MVAYNLRKVENRDRYPDPPKHGDRRNSLVAGLRVVAAAAWVRFPVSASSFFLVLTHAEKKNEARGIRTPNLWVWNPTRCHCAIASAVSPFVPALRHKSPKLRRRNKNVMKPQLYQRR